MLPVNFPGAYIAVDKAPNASDEHSISGVPAWCGTDTETGFFCYLFAWQPNREDLEAIKAGKPVMVKIFASPCPQHTMFTLDDNGTPN